MTPATQVGLIAVGAAACAAWGAWQILQRYSARRVADLTQLAREDLVELFLFVDPVRLARGMAWLLLALAAVGLWRGWGLPVVLPLLVAWLAAPRLLLRTLAKRRRMRLRHELPDAAAALAARLRAGMALPQALGALAAESHSAIAQEVGLVLRRHRLGLSLDDALAELGPRLRLPELDLFVGAVRIGRELGAGMAEALERLAETLRRRRVVEDRIRALTAQGRMQGLIVSLLPPAVAAALAVIEPRATMALVTTPKGWAVLAVVLALQAAGWLLIRRIIDIDV